ncbi:MAG: hypothetical protein IPM29_27435 [Planctomycetes bacterium]|nr:hypothetical protein [Planctomycetota bacterium]
MSQLPRLLHRLALLTTAAAALASAAAAQSGPLIGFGADPLGANPATLRQALCNPAATACLNTLPAPAEAWSGGAAVDPVRNSLWHSQGTRLLELGLDTCATGCAMPADLVLGPVSRVGGLTFDATAGTLLHVESVPGIAAVVTYGFTATGGCPTRIGVCRFPLPTAAHHAGAIALDRADDLLFVAASDFGPAGPQNRILVIDRNGPGCDPICYLPALACNRGTLQAIRAMAYDACARRLYVSDGRQTAVFVVQMGSTRCPTLIAESCCPTAAPGGQLWAGFDRLPTAPRQLGGGCLPPRVCPTCPTVPRLTATGLPVLGNAGFGFRIEDAPNTSTGFVVVNVGPCGNVPFGCGTLFAQPPVLAIGPAPMLGAACGGSGAFPLALPDNVALCNLLLCAQGLVVCQAGGLGLTNGLVVPLSY